MGKKLFVTFCILLGCMTGYEVVQFTGIGSGKLYNRIMDTKDNTLDKEKDSVFFSSNKENLNEDIVLQESFQIKDNKEESVVKKEESLEDEKELKKAEEIEIIITPTIAVEPLEKVEEQETIGQVLIVTPVAESDINRIEPIENDKEKKVEIQVEERENIGEKQEEITEKKEEVVLETEWKVNEIIAKGIKDKITIGQTEGDKIKTEDKEKKIIEEEIEYHVKITQIPEKTDKKIEDTQVFTYPTEIFGQTPIVNRSDEYVTYFEFALDLIETVEEEVKERELSETALFAKFVVKALFCGVDLKTIKINDAISRSEAALALWLAAQIMEEQGTNTSSASLMSYVTDLGNCSSSEKKAIAYLYEQGIISGYKIEGQIFLPSSHLKTEDSREWIKKIKQCWK